MGEQLPNLGIVIDHKKLWRLFTHGPSFWVAVKARSLVRCNRKKPGFVTKCGFRPIRQHFVTNSDVRRDNSTQIAQREQTSLSIRVSSSRLAKRQPEESASNDCKYRTWAQVDLFPSGLPLFSFRGARGNSSAAMTVIAASVEKSEVTRSITATGNVVAWREIPVSSESWRSSRDRDRGRRGRRRGERAGIGAPRLGSYDRGILKQKAAVDELQASLAIRQIGRDAGTFRLLRSDKRPGDRAA